MTRRPSRRRRETGNSDVAVCDGREPLGRVLFLGDDWRAELADGTSLGTYGTRTEAREALSEVIRARRAAA